MRLTLCKYKIVSGKNNKIIYKPLEDLQDAYEKYQLCCALIARDFHKDEDDVSISPCFVDRISISD